VAFDPPWRLDPLKNIVNVGWKGAANILMIHVSVNVQLHAPRSVPVQPLRLSNVPDVFGDPIRQNDDHIPAPVIVDPISSDMLAHSYLWNKTPVKPGANSDLQYRWRAVLFLNLGKIKTLEALSTPEKESYTVTLIFPASEKNTETGIILNAFTTFGVENDWEAAKASAPHPISDVQFVVDGPRTLVGNILTFGSQAERATFLSLNGEWFSHDEPASGNTWDLLDWEVKAYTYQQRKTFPLNDSLDPTYAPDAKQIAFQVQHDHATVDVQIPARTVTFTINLNSLAMTSTKV
jgi:hypothetical protein